MYSRPPKWSSNQTQASSGAGGYSPTEPGANQPANPAARHVPGNQTFQPQNAQPAMPAAQQPKASAPQNRTNTQPSAATIASAHQVTLRRVQPDADVRGNVNGNRKAASPSPQNGADQGSLSPKIWKVAGSKKFIDFNSKLTMAYVNDYANIHGCGGTGHAGNSTIGIVICDYTAGTGKENSVTVKYNLDVEDVGFLYEAAMSARLGLLKPDPGINVSWIEQTQHIMAGWKNLPKAPDGSRQIPAQALNTLNSALNNARAATTAQLTNPLFSYVREKNNPYTGINGLVPCSRVTINYTPYRKDGAPSNYPWYIAIENFEAPLSVGANGASSHNSKQAVNKRSAFINLNCESFCNAMTAVQRFVNLWEHRAIPMIDEAYRRMEHMRTERRNQE